MRFKLLSLFVVIQMLSFGVWNLTHVEADVSEPSVLAPAAEPTQAQSPRVYPAHPSSTRPVSSTVSTTRLSMPAISGKNMAQEEEAIEVVRENQIRAALTQMPQAHVDAVKNIILDYNPEVNRGLGGNYTIILRAVGVTDEEFVGVLLHELGHNVDYATLSQSKTNRKSPFKDGQLPIYETDQSLDFYRISWLKTDRIKTQATNMDFVSGYAMTDPFEDFAETYAYYILHNNDFKRLALSSPALAAKYDFMKNTVFAGQEFDMGDGIIDISERPWDTTVLPYDLEAFMG